MHSYVFKAKDSRGSLLSGDIQADRRETVITALKQRGYYLLSVEQQDRISAFFRHGLSLRSHISVRERAIFTHQLATLLRAGMQLTIALKTLAKQTQNKHLTSVINQIYIDIERSSSLSEAMAKHTRIFPKVYTSIVEAAEQSGSLAETLSILSAQLKAQASVNARIRAAVAYPLFLLVVSAVVVGVLTIFVIPKFIELFVNAKQALPLPTRILVTATDIMKNFWWACLFAIAAIMCLGWAVMRDERIRLSVDGWLLKLPIVGTLN